MGADVLLLRPDKAGDALKTLPVLRALRSLKLEIRLHLLASEHNASLFEFEPGIVLHILPKNWRRMKADRWMGLLRKRNFPSSFTKIVNLLCDPSEEAEILLKSLSGDEKISANLPRALNEQDRKPYRLVELPELTPRGREESKNICIIVSQAMGVNLPDHVEDKFGAAPVLSPLDLAEAEEKMGEKCGLWLGVCPFAGTSQRTLPVKRWERFIPRVTANPDFQKVFLFGTPHDYQQLEKLRQLSAIKEQTELCFPSSFRTLAAYLKRLDGVVTVDSGPLHLARSLEVRSLGILSGGDVKRWYSPTHASDLILRRGILNRYPSTLEMVWAYQKWKNFMVAS